MSAPSVAVTPVSRAPRAGLAGALAVLLAGLLGVTGVVLAPPADASPGTFVSLINSARAAKGLPALSSNGQLASVAASWTQKMAASGKLAHNPRLAGQVSGYRFVGENVGYGPDARTIHRAFMNSSGHRANILDRDYSQVGVAVVTVDGRMWVTEVFRAPVGAPAKQAAPKKATPKKAEPKKAAPKKATPKKPASTEAPAKPAPAKKAPAKRPPATAPTSQRPTGQPSRPARPAPVTTPASAPAEPIPTAEELLQQRAAAAAAGPGAAAADDPVQQALRFVEVLRATHG
jgi:hypothetical protein